MAYKKKPKASKGEDAPRPTKEQKAQSEANKKLLKRILERSKIMIEADSENRDAAKADITDAVTAIRPMRFSHPVNQPWTGLPIVAAHQ